MEGTIGEMRMVAYNWAPRQWQLCHGQLVAIASNTALFSIIGTIYGGDGRTTFALPDYRGRVPLQQGTGPGLPTYPIGSRGGVDEIGLNILELPTHNHNVDSTSIEGHANLHAHSTATGNVEDPTNANMSFTASPSYSSTPDGALGSSAVQVGGSLTMNVTGGSTPHENRQPFIALNYVICEVGVYPSRN